VDFYKKNSSEGRSRSITKALLTRIIVASFLSMGVLIGFFTYWEYRDFQSRTQRMRRDHVESQMALVRGEVQKAVDYVLYEKSLTEDRLREQIRNRVYEAHAVATNIYREHGGNETDEDIRKMIKDALRPSRFNRGRGYYFATNLDGKEELFADRPEEEGKDYLDVRDTQGRYLVREMIEVAKSDGEGFVEYTWTKPGKEKDDYPKVAFVKLFEPLNYLIGTGEYLDDTTVDIQAEVLKRIGKIRYAGDGYIFVVSYNGIVLSGHPKQKNIGKNLWEMEDADGIKVIQEERRAVENPEGDFIRYRWPKPGAKEPSPKISFLKGVPDWEWMVGTGVYVDEMEPVIAEMARSLRTQVLQRSFLVGAVFFALVLIMLTLAGQSSRRIKEGFAAFSAFFEKAAADSVRVDEKKLYFSELRRLAVPANRMVDERQRFEEKLRSELEMRSMIQVSLEESEGKLKNLFSSIRDVIIVADNDRVVIDANQPALRDKFGYETEDIVGRKTSVLYAHETSFREAGREIFDSKQERVGKMLEVDFKKKNGDIFPAELSALKLIGDDGRSIGNIGVIRDITERKKSEDLLKEAKKSLEKQNEELRKIDQMKEGLLHAVSHELKTPVAKYAMQLEILKPIVEKHELSGAEREALAVMEKSLRRQEGVIKNLLDLARLEGGSRKFRREPLRVDELIRKVREDYQDLLLRHGGEMTVTMPPMTIHSDGEMLWHLFSNLISNAIKFRKSETPLRISVDAETGDGKVTVRVADTGVGFTEEERGQAFERFYQSTPSNEGSGVGLAICRIIADGLGGEISINSEGKDRGTVVNITLPAG
jgi:PAS domain S-box-containing protein